MAAIGLNRDHSMFYSSNRRFLILVSILAIPAIARASNQGLLEAGRPTVRNYLASEYQARAQNMVVVQDSRGLFYFGNGDQVLEFDGETWRGIPVPHAAHVRALAVDEHDRVYVGGVNELGYLDTDSQGGKRFISLVSHLPSSALNFGELWSISITPQGVFYTASQHLFLWANQHFIVWRLPSDSRLSSQWLGDSLYVTQPGVGLLKLED